MSPEGQRVDLLDGAYRYAAPRRRRGARRGGRLRPAPRLSPLPRASPSDPAARRDGGSSCATPSGDEFQVQRARRSPSDDPLATRLAILREFAERPARQGRASRRGLRTRRWSGSSDACERPSRSPAWTSTATEPESPEVTVIVPLYGRIDFVEHQLAHFGRDPEFARGRPDLRARLARAGRGRSRGARAPLHGAARRVLPGRPTLRATSATRPPTTSARSWRGRLAAAAQLGRDPGRGGVAGPHARVPRSDARTSARSGPKLLFEDESIQHAGMYFERRARLRPVGQPALLQGVQPHADGGEREPPRARGDGRLHDGRAGALRAGGRPVGRLRATAATRTRTSASA